MKRHLKAWGLVAACFAPAALIVAGPKWALLALMGVLGLVIFCCTVALAYAATSD